MKKIRITFICCCIILFATCFLGCANAKAEYLRIHIRANSNLITDQNVKYEIRDAVVEYLTPIIKTAHSKEEAILKIRSNESAVKELIEILL